MEHAVIEQLRDNEVIFAYKFDPGPFSFDDLQILAQNTLRRRRPYVDVVRIRIPTGREITWAATDELDFTSAERASVADVKQVNTYRQHSEFCAEMAEKSVADRETWTWFSQEWLKLAARRTLSPTTLLSTTLFESSPAIEAVLGNHTALLPVSDVLEKGQGTAVENQERQRRKPRKNFKRRGMATRDAGLAPASQDPQQNIHDALTVTS